MRRFLLCTALFSAFISTIFADTPPPDTTNLREFISTVDAMELHKVLVDRVYELYLQYGEERIPEERYLIDLMHLINREVSRRLQNPKEARQKYFRELHDMLKEIQQVKSRLKASGIKELDVFANDLEARIAYTIEEGVVDFRKKKIFEDALQMLLVSEEMVRLDQTEGGSDLAQQVQQYKSKLLNAFGEVTPVGAVPEGQQANIYHLFVEWKKTDLVKYERRLADVQLARKNLLKASGMEEILRMFNDELRLAYTYFNLGDFEVAQKLLIDLIETYPRWGIKNTDDLYFYRAECSYALNHFVHAREYYEALINTFPATPYLPEAYRRLIHINYDLQDYEKAVEYADLYQNIATTSEPEYLDALFITALAHYHLGNFNQTVELLQNIPSNYPHYYLAQYFIGNAYSRNQLFDEAAEVYTSLVNNESTPVDIHMRSLYKLGILAYEKKDYQNAIAYLQRIPEDYSRYDKVLNALAWSYFEVERNKPLSEIRDFSQAVWYAERLVNEYYASPYRMEATSLLAYVNQLIGESSDALSLYREVYETKAKRPTIAQYARERDRLEKLYREAVSVRNKAITENNTTAFARANRLVEKLGAQIERLDLSEGSGVGLAVYQEIHNITSQLKELNRLRLLAEQNKDKKAVEKIDSLQFRLGAVLETFPPELIEESNYVNLFDAYPISKYVVDEEHKAEKVREMRKAMKEEVDRILMLEIQLAEAKQKAREEQNYLLLTRLDIEERKLDRLRRRYDELLSLAYQMEVNDNPYPDFNKWGDLGAFGIINVYFEQKQKTNFRLSKTAEILAKVNEQLDRRKQVIEDKIKKIEAEIRFMTMKARMEERARLRAERERAFRESYFDTRESEEEQQ
ncbi:MAG: hypothetical protein D6748_05060 [Calditrichaeota bacterium]|nr:MAG: hypothetical protein D6748_05060 [Calditrichota bacterium]